MTDGLATKPRKQNDFDSFLKESFGPAKPKAKPLNDRIEALSNKDLNTVMLLAQLVKLAATFQGKNRTYKSLVDSMYPRVSRQLRNLVAEMLQQADPIDDPLEERAKATKQQKDQTDELLAKYKPSPIKEGKAALADKVISSVMGKLGNTREQKPNGNLNIDLPGKLVVDDQGRFASKRDFIKALQPIAEDVSKELGIDPKIVMAQAILETGYGSKVKGNNYFGIKSHGKAGGQTFATQEEVDGLMVKKRDRFRKYDSLEDSVRDYGAFLQENKRYRPLLEAKTLDDQIEALAKSGYVTDSRYGDKIRGIIKGRTFMELLG